MSCDPNCPCLPVEKSVLKTNDLQDLSDAQLNVAIEAAYYSFLVKRLGALCAEQFCAALATARANENLNADPPVTWQSLMLSPWSLVVNSRDFQLAYANAVKLKAIAKGTFKIMRGGNMEVARNGTDIAGVDYTHKQASSEKTRDAKNDIIEEMEAQWEVFMQSVWRPNAALFECVPIDPCDCPTPNGTVVRRQPIPKKRHGYA